MNDKLQDALTELISNSTSFVQGQMPDVIEQLLAWERTRLTWAIAIESFIGIVCGTLLVFAWRWLVKEREDDFVLPLMAGTVFIVLVGVICPVCDAFSFAKVTMAPKAWLLEYAKAFAK